MDSGHFSGLAGVKGGCAAILTAETQHAQHIFAKAPRCCHVQVEVDGVIGQCKYKNDGLSQLIGHWGIYEETPVKYNDVPDGDRRCKNKECYTYR